MTDQATAPDYGSSLRLQLLAAAYVELLRPLFTRWAADEAKRLYGRVTEAMWAGIDGTLDNASGFLREIEERPEAHYDDSHHRDHYIMMGLGVLHYAVKVVQGAQADAASSSDLEELCGLVASLMNEFEVSGIEEELSTISTHVAQNAGDAARAMRNASEEKARLVDGALPAVAEEYGWPLERAKRPD